MKLSVYKDAVNLVVGGVTTNLPNGIINVGSDFSKQKAFHEDERVYRSKTTVELISKYGDEIPAFPDTHISASLRYLPMDAEDNPLPYSLAVVSSNIFENGKSLPAATVELWVFGKVAKFYSVDQGYIIDRAPDTSLEVSVNFTCSFPDSIS